MVVEGAVEMYQKTIIQSNTRTKEQHELGRILLKGENIVLVRSLEYVLYQI